MSYIDTFSQELDRMRKEEKYDFYAWPGGYPLYYLSKDNSVLCPSCLNNHFDESLEEEDNPEWFIVAYEINWESTDLYCEHCNQLISPAYGD